MNKYLSVIGLYARWNLWKILTIILTTALVSGLLICRAPAGLMVLEENYVNPDTGETTQLVADYGKLESAVENSRTPIVCAVGFAAIAAVMSLTGCGYGVKTAYTVRRLRVKEKRAVLLWAVYCAVLLVIYWAALAAVMYGAMVYRMGIDVPTDFRYGSQSMLLLCYDDTFLHHLIPLRDAAMWALGAASVLAVSISSAVFSYCQRRGKFSVLILAAAGLTILSFFYDMGSDTLFVLLALLLVIAGCGLVTILGGDGDEA